MACRVRSVSVRPEDDAMSLTVDGYEWCEVSDPRRETWMRLQGARCRAVVMSRSSLLRRWALVDINRWSYHCTRRGAMRAYAKRRGAMR